MKLIGELAVGRTRGQVIDQAVAKLKESEGSDRLSELLEGLGWVKSTVREMADEVSETLELVRSMPDPVVASVGQPSNPLAIPGVVQGVQNLPARPFRETGSQRAARERQERQDRARGQDSVDDLSFDRSDQLPHE